MLSVTRTVFASFDDAMSLIRKAKQKKIAYSYWDLEELSADEANYISKVLERNIYFRIFPTIRDFSLASKRDAFKKNPVKITFFLEKPVDLKR